MAASVDFLRRGVLPALLVLLAGCASLAPAPSTLTGGSVAAQAVASYHGRFAVRYADNNGVERNVYGNFELLQHGDTATLQLLNPLGQTLARVVASGHGATLELPGQTPRGAPDVETLMQRAIGFPLPIDGLRYWLKPAPAPHSEAQTTIDPGTGRLAQIRQDGWTIDYLGYTDDSAASAIKRLNLTRADPALDVKLVLDQ
jgi:outer membrane lipoprotein LolB